MKRENIESAFRLTGLQESFLYHHLQAGQHDQGVIQLRTEIAGNLPLEVLEQAWIEIIAHQPTLRTSFHWKDIKHPVQAVHKQAPFACTILDWSTEAPSKRQSLWEQLVAEDRSKGLDLTQAPTFRVTLVKFEKNDFRMLWTCHHILLDGWSSALILKEVFQYCRCRLKNETWHPHKATPFQKYVAWEQSLPTLSHARKWRQLIREDHQQSVSLSASSHRVDKENQAQQDFHFEAIQNQEINQAANACNVTPTSLLIATWAVLLSRVKDSPHCLLGLTVSGRMGPFPDNPSMVGMFANSIPFPVNVPPDSSLQVLISQVFSTQEALQTLESSPVAQVHTWCHFPPGKELFDTLLIIDNYPVEETNAEDPFHIVSSEGQLSTQVPLTLVISTRNHVSLQLIYNPEVFDKTWVEALGLSFEATLKAILKKPELSCNDLSIDLPSLETDVSEQEQAIDSASTSMVEEVSNFDEGLIRDIWEETLGIKNISPKADFFKLGGTSLQAAHLVETLQQVFQKPIPLNILFEAPTIQSMARALISEEASNWPILVLLQKGGSRPPLFLFHEMGVSIFHYLPLIRHLPEDLPVYGVQAPYEALSDIPTMTNLYLEEIKKLYPEGKILLGGYCFGGMLAYDMAQRLTQLGEPVDKVFIIELAFSHLVRFRPRYLWKILTSETPKQHAIRIKEKIGKIAGRVLRMFKPGEKGFKDEASDYFDTSSLPDTTRIRTENYYRVARDYRPLPYEGELVVLLCDTVYSQRDPSAGWDRLARGKIELHRSSSDHHSILDEPYVREVADLINKHLR